MAKMEMRVIPESSVGDREVMVAEKHGGSMVIKGYDETVSLLCGNCRDVLLKNVDPDKWIVYSAEGEPYASDEFTPLYRSRDIVFRCKGCGAYNEIGEGHDLPSR
jgi:hypothetical protein